MPRTVLSSTFGNAFVFNGSSSVVSIGTMGSFFSSLTAGAFTIALWQKNTNTSSTNNVLGNVTSLNKSIQLQLNRDVADATSVGRVRMFIRDADNTFHSVATTNTQSGLSDGTFRHLAISGIPSAPSYQYYYGGAAVATSVSSGSPVDNFANFTTPFTIGAINVNGTVGSYFTGSLDDVRFYNVVLTAGEIQMLAAGMDVRRGLVRLYNFDTSGANDLSNSNNSAGGVPTGITLETGAIPLYRLQAA